MKRRKEGKVEATARDEIGREEQIVDQALKLFSQTGYHGTSLQEIADELGITRPAFYYYFNSKDDLLWRLIGHLGDHLLEETRPIASQPGTPSEKLHQLMVAHTRAILGNADAFRIYFAERHLVEPWRDRHLRPGEDQYARLYEEIIRQGQEDGVFRDESPHLLGLIVLGLANSTLRWFQSRRDLSADQVGGLIADLAVAAIAKPGAAPRPNERRRPRGGRGSSARAAADPDAGSWSSRPLRPGPLRDGNPADRVQKSN